MPNTKSRKSAGTPTHRIKTDQRAAACFRLAYYPYGRLDLSAFSTAQRAVAWISASSWVRSVRVP